MLTKPFIDGRKVLKEIETYDHQAYFVGGCVRDLLLGRRIGDIDIATSAFPENIQEIFPKVIPIGIEHGTVIVRFQQVSYEVTTFRLDGKYTDQRHPDTVEFIDQIDEDLKRRDFTINALAMDKEGNIIDLFHGEEDLKAKVIRTVGDGYERFIEDPLRIIRALRFASQLGFSIEQKTRADIDKVKEQITTIAIERITNEFTKLFAGEFVNYGIDYLKRTSVYHYLPVLAEHPHIIESFPENIEPLSSFGEVLAHFHYIDQTISIHNWTKAWKCSNKIKQEAIHLVKALDYFKQHGLDQWLVYQLNPLSYASFTRLVKHFSLAETLKLSDINHLSRKLNIRSKQDLAINGNDLIQLFPETKRGAWIQETLTNVEKEVVFGRLKNNERIIKEWIICNPPHMN